MSDKNFFDSFFLSCTEIWPSSWSHCFLYLPGALYISFHGYFSQIICCMSCISSWCLPLRRPGLTQVISQDLIISVCSSFVYNSPILKTIHMSISRWTDKQFMPDWKQWKTVQSWSEWELITKRCDVTDGYKKCYVKWKEPDAKENMTYGFIYVKLYQRQILSVSTERRLVLAWDRIFSLLEYCLYNQYFDSDSVYWAK